MIAPRWRKVLRDLWLNRTRTFLVVLSIAVGVAAIGMVAGSQVALTTDLQTTYAQVNPASANIFLLTTFDEDLVETIRSLDEVEEAEGRRYVFVRFRGEGDEWFNLQLTAVPDFNDMRLNKIWPQEGAWPPPEGTVLIERASFQPQLGLGDVGIGDTLLVEPPDGRVRQLTISGTAHDLNQFPAALAGSGYGYITFDTLEGLGEPRNFNQLFFIVADHKDDIDHIQVVGNAVTDRLEKAGQVTLFTFIFPPGEHPMQLIIDPMSLLLGVMGFLALFLSAFLIINTLSAILAQEVKQIGIMKAIGAQVPQIMQLYFGTVIILGLLAIVVAVPLGAIGARLFSSFMASFINFDLKAFSIPLRVIGLQVAVGLTIPLLAALYPIISGSRISVREAVSEQRLGKGQFGSSWIDRLIMRLRRLSRPVLLSLRNTFRRRGRLALTLITLSLSSAIFIAVFSVRASLLLTLEDALEYFDYDVGANFSVPYRVEEIRREALQVPGVVEVESWGFSNARLVRDDGTESGSIIVYAPQADTQFLKPVFIDGRWLRPDDETAVVINSDLLRDDPDLAVGDVITMKLEGKEVDLAIVGIVRSSLIGAAVYLNYPYFARHLAQEVGKARVAQVLTTNHEPEFQSKVALALEQQFRGAGLRVEAIQTIQAIRQPITLAFNIIVVFLLFMAMLLAVVGGLGLMGTMSINVIERQREIGVMRAIGASDSAVLQVVLIEGLVIGWMSWLIGAVAALPISKILADAVGYAFFRASPSYRFSLPGTLLWLVVVLVLALVASYLPARRASQLTVREVIAYE